MSTKLIRLNVILSVIPRLHDEAGSTSWLYERSSSQLVERRSSSDRRALVDRRSTSSFVNVCNITPFKWLDSQLIKPARRALDERSSSARRAGSTSQLVEPASSCKWGISYTTEALSEERPIRERQTGKTCNEDRCITNEPMWMRTVMTSGMRYSWLGRTNCRGWETGSDDCSCSWIVPLGTTPKSPRL